MNLKFIKKINTTDLYLDIDSLAFIIKREYSRDSLSLIYKLKELETEINIPHIINVEMCEDKITTYEQYIDGQTIQEMIDKSMFITKQQFDSYIQQLVSILHILHQNDIIHKDIKPDNIVVKNDVIYLIDFNISRMYKQQRSKDTQLFGTEGFASPEQYGFSQTTSKSDIYSLGKTIEQMLQITVTKPLEYDEYKQLIEQMTCLDPQMRIGLEQITDVKTQPKSRHFVQTIINASKPFPGIVQTSGIIPVKLFVTYFYLAFAYIAMTDLFDIKSKSKLYINVICIFLIGVYMMNIWVLPHTRKWYEKSKNLNIIFKLIWGTFIFTIELFIYGLAVYMVLDILRAIINL